MKTEIGQDAAITRRAAQDPVSRLATCCRLADADQGDPGVCGLEDPGHAKPSTTTILYGHVVPDGQQAAAKVIDEIAAPIAVEMDSGFLVAQTSGDQVERS